MISRRVVYSMTGSPRRNLTRYNSMKHVATAPKLPIADNATASYPRPCSSNLCAGSIDTAVSSSGTPRKVAGIALWNEWLMEVETKRHAIIRGMNAMGKP